MNTREAQQQELDRLEQELAARRERVGQLVGALENKLSPGQWMGQGADWARQLGRSAKDHPMPSLMTAAGLAWLYLGKDSASSPSLGSSLGGSGAGMMGSIKDKAHGAKAAIGERAHRTGQGARHLLEENPMAAGAIAIAAGALLGALLPPTDKEDQMLGETRDRLAERARQLAAQAAEQARQAERSGGGAQAIRAEPTQPSWSAEESQSAAITGSASADGLGSDPTSTWQGPYGLPPAGAQPLPPQGPMSH
jgi:hypothetical protein